MSSGLRSGYVPGKTAGVSLRPMEASWAVSCSMVAIGILWGFVDSRGKVGGGFECGEKVVVEEGWYARRLKRKL